MSASVEHKIVRPAFHYLLTFAGCLKLLKLASVVLATLCSVISPHWLARPAGGFTIFLLVIVLLYILIFMILHLCCDVTGLPKLHKAELFGGFVVTVVLLVATITCSVEAGIYHFTMGDDGVGLKMDNSLIYSTAVFTGLALIFSSVKSLYTGTAYYRHLKKQTSSVN